MLNNCFPPQGLLTTQEAGALFVQQLSVTAIIIGAPSVEKRQSMVWQGIAGFKATMSRAISLERSLDIAY
jgi:hypothetical protein